MVPVRERHQFAEAIKTKIIREIAGLAPEALIVPTQAQSAPKANCEMGAAPWRN
jgi:hypothetical protein